MSVFLSCTGCRNSIRAEKRQCLLRTATFPVREREKIKRKGLSNRHLACEHWLLSCRGNRLKVDSAVYVMKYASYLKCVH